MSLLFFLRSRLTIVWFDVVPCARRRTVKWQSRGRSAARHGLSGNGKIQSRADEIRPPDFPVRIASTENSDSCWRKSCCTVYWRTLHCPVDRRLRWGLLLRNLATACIVSCRRRACGIGCTGRLKACAAGPAWNVSFRFAA